MLVRASDCGYARLAATAAEFATFSSSTTTTATEAATARAIFLRPSFVDGEGAAIKFFAVELRYGSGGFFLRAHGDEGEAAGLAREFVHDEFARLHVAGLLEQVEHITFGGVKRQVSYE